MNSRRILNVLLSSAACAALVLTLPATASANASAQPAEQATALTSPEAQPTLVGHWDIVTLGGAPLEEGVFGFIFNADGTGEWIDGDVENEPLVYSYDAEADLYTLQIEEEEVVTFRVEFEGDEAMLIPNTDDPAYPPLGLRRADNG